MRDLILLAIDLLLTLARFLQPSAVAAESLVLKHQLLVLGRSRQRVPNLTTLDRFVLGLTTLFMRPHRIPRLSVILKPATLLKFHKTLVDGKYRRLFSSSGRLRKPGPKGPSEQLLAAIVEMKQRNPKFGCVRIARQISHAFGLDVDKDVVRRVLAKHYRPDGAGSNGPSWLTFIAQSRDSLWSVDLFRCESTLLRSCSVMLVMDVFTRRIIGLGVERAVIDGVDVCRMFNAPSLASRRRHTSAPTTTRCFGFIAGSPTCAYSKSTKSRRFQLCRFRIRLWND